MGERPSILLRHAAPLIEAVNCPQRHFQSDSRKLCSLRRRVHCTQAKQVQDQGTIDVRGAEKVCDRQCRRNFARWRRQRGTSLNHSVIPRCPPRQSLITFVNGQRRPRRYVAGCRISHDRRRGKRDGPGDAVWIGAGTYSEQVTCLNSGNASSVISYLADTTEAMGDAGSVTVSNGGITFNGNGRSYININGITILGGSPGMSFDGGSAIAIQSCDVSGANNGININNATVTMTNSAAHNNSGQGVYIGGSSNVTITACNFYSNTAYGIYAGVTVR